MLHKSHLLFVLTALAVLTLTAGADTQLKKKPAQITAKHRLSWKDVGAPVKHSRFLSCPLIIGNSQEALHPTKPKDDTPKPPEFVQKIRDMSEYKVKDW